MKIKLIRGPVITGSDQFTRRGRSSDDSIVQRPEGVSTLFCRSNGNLQTEQDLSQRRVVFPHGPSSQVFSICFCKYLEGWAKRHYENTFRGHLQEAIGSAQETKNWLDFAFECGYLSEEQHSNLFGKYEEICKMLHGLHERWHTPAKDQMPDIVNDN